METDVSTTCCGPGDLKVISVSPFKEVARGGGQVPMFRHAYSTQVCVNICRNIYICVSVGMKAPS